VFLCFRRRIVFPISLPLRILGLAGLFFLAPAATPPAADSETSLKSDLKPSLGRSRILVLNCSEAWKRLPGAERGGGQPLPIWARALANTLPHTTAAMLELDFLQRARSPLEQKLRGRMRWVAAHANGCRYSEAYAEADLRRAGVSETDIGKLAGNLDDFPADTRAALRFARKLSRDGSSVTDGEVSQLIAQHGERQVVAMVLLLAYSSFQDRLILGLGLSLEQDEPLAPLEVRFAKRPLGSSRRAPPRIGSRTTVGRTNYREITDPFISSIDFIDIRDKLAGQQATRCRIPLPDADPQASRWGLVCRTYQPELGDAWAACAHAFADEANPDPVFEQSVFWIVTRTIQCFY
jgi:alkylhydroperoxidase family enzyme